jgi:hypothetical protein
MGVSDFESRMRHIRISGTDGSEHVIPYSVFFMVSEGAIPITRIEDWENIVPQLVKEWLQWVDSGYRA